MSFTFLSHSLRQILPRKEIRERDRRSGAYPVKSKTGDRTRTGRNKVYFDDERAVLFLTGVNITYPTTLQFDPGKVAGDLTASLEATVVGSVDPYAVDQFIPHRDQNEPPRAFFDCDLFEQDETNVVNSKFMTGVAYSIAPDRFKSKLSNKTIIRKDFVLRHVSQMSTGSGIMYFNEASGCFVRKNPEYSFIANGQGLGIFTFAALPFTPYGMAYMPLNDYAVSGYGGSGYYNLPAAEASVRRMSSYAADGTDNLFFDISGFNTGFVTASLLNPGPGHVATNDQTVSLTNELGHPFLIEKIVVEFPFQAGPGWLNDSFRLREVLVSDLQYAADAGGPLITFAVMRQDATDLKHRDLIASGTITNMLDMSTDRYTICTGVYGGGGGYTDIVVTPDGVGGLGIIPNATITGSFLSASDNFYTGTVKMVLEPQITSHVLRTRASGSAYWFLTNVLSPTTAFGAVFGSIARRSSKYLDSGRSILGNSFALLDPAKLNQRNNPINVMDSQYEDLPQKPSAPRIARSKLYLDVKSNTIKSPYLLYPEDKLVFCLSKHRAVGDDTLADVLFGEYNSDPTSFMSYHDVAIGTGSFKITLYGDLIREDVEFHDTLNQRLETEEIWEDIGEDPVLDQFDVSYRVELSGSYIDRFTVANALSGYGRTDLSASNQINSYYSHFSSKDNSQTGWSTQYAWSSVRSVESLKKNNRNVNHASLNEKFWDSRIPDPLECIKTCNSNYRLYGGDAVISTISFVLYTGDALFAQDVAPTETGRGIRDWMMTYPYDQRYQGLTQKFSNTISRDIMSRKDPESAGTFVGLTPYKALSMEIGHSGSNGIHRRVCSEYDTNFSTAHAGLTTSEFIKAFYGIGDGRSNVDNQHVTFRRGQAGVSQSVVIRGWRHGMMSAFPLRSTAVYRRDRFGQPRDLLEQRLDAKFFDEVGLSPDGTSNGVVGVKTGPVQVYFYDNTGKQTDALKTLSSNVSFEATSSVPYCDGVARNRTDYDTATLNVSRVIF